MGFGVQVVTAFQSIRELAAVYVFERRVARILHFGKAHMSADANSFKSRMLPMTSVSKVKAG